MQFKIKKSLAMQALNTKCVLSKTGPFLGGVAHWHVPRAPHPEVAPRYDGDRPNRRSISHCLRKWIIVTTET